MTWRLASTALAQIHDGVSTPTAVMAVVACVSVPPLDRSVYLRGRRSGLGLTSHRCQLQSRKTRSPPKLFLHRLLLLLLLLSALGGLRCSPHMLDEKKGNDSF